MRGWTVQTSRAAAANGTTGCVSAYSDTASRSVTLRSVPNQAELPIARRYSRIATRLRSAVHGRCLTGSQIVRAARAAAAGGGLGADEFSITRVADPSARCARMDMVIGGLMQVTVRAAP